MDMMTAVAKQLADIQGQIAGGSLTDQAINELLNGLRREVLSHSLAGQDVTLDIVEGYRRDAIEQLEAHLREVFNTVQKGVPTPMELLALSCSAQMFVDKTYRFFFLRNTLGTRNYMKKLQEESNGQ